MGRAGNASHRGVGTGWQDARPPDSYDDARDTVWITPPGAGNRLRRGDSKTAGGGGNWGLAALDLRYPVRDAVDVLTARARPSARDTTGLTETGVQDFFAQPDRLRGDFDKFVVPDELDRLLQTQDSWRHQADRLIRRGRAHIG